MHRGAASPGSGPILVPAAADVLLGLQRTAGNAAVGRACRPAAPCSVRAGPRRARGWNVQNPRVDGHAAHPDSKAFSQGHQTRTSTPNTKEIAGDKAERWVIAIVPDGTDLWAGKLEALLLFHGLGESVGIGYRERTTEYLEASRRP